MIAKNMCSNFGYFTCSPPNTRKLFLTFERGNGGQKHDEHAMAIYNVDESSMPLDHQPPCVKSLKGQRKARYRTWKQKSNYSNSGCMCS